MKRGSILIVVLIAIVVIIAALAFIVWMNNSQSQNGVTTLNQAIPTYFVLPQQSGQTVIASSTVNASGTLLSSEQLAAQGETYTLPGGQMSNAGAIITQMFANKWVSTGGSQTPTETIIRLGNGQQKLLIELKQQGGSNGQPVTTLVTVIPIENK